MNATLSEILDLFTRGREAIAPLLRQTDQPGRRAVLLTELLRALWPSAPLYACFLREGGQAHGCVGDAAGRPRADWEEPLGAELARYGEGGAAPAAAAGALLRTWKLPAQTLAAAPIGSAEHGRGALAVAVPESAPPETAALVQALLALCAEHLALRLELEDLERQRRALVEELAGQARLADFGELAGPVAHELNNFLNLVLLHVAVLEPEVPPGLRHELAEIRRQGASAGALVKQLQQSPRRPPVWQPVDLNRVVRQVVAAGRLAPGGAAVQLALAPVLPPVLGSVTDVERLVTFLLTNAAAAAAGGSVHLRTEAAADKVVLRVEDTGPAVAAETLHRLFEPGHAGREGTSSLELAACERLARRLRGRIWGESRAEGGLVVTVELPAHAP